MNIFRRVSSGWKEGVANSKYKEGKGFHTFSLEGYIFTTAICGDLWFEDNINKISNMYFDVLLWPLYIDYRIEEWKEEGIFDYALQVKKIKSNILMINSIIHGEANGGCVVFEKGWIKDKSDMGLERVLPFIID